MFTWTVTLNPVFAAVPHERRSIAHMDFFKGGNNEEGHLAFGPDTKPKEQVICVYIYICIYLYIHMYIFISLSLSIYIYICIYKRPSSARGSDSRWFCMTFWALLFIYFMIQRSLLNCNKHNVFFFWLLKATHFNITNPSQNHIYPKRILGQPFGGI